MFFGTRISSIVIKFLCTTIFESQQVHSICLKFGGETHVPFGNCLYLWYIYNSPQECITIPYLKKTSCLLYLLHFINFYHCLMPNQLSSSSHLYLYDLQLVWFISPRFYVYLICQFASTNIVNRYCILHWAVNWLTSAFSN